MPYEQLFIHDDIQTTLRESLVGRTDPHLGGGGPGGKGRAAEGVHREVLIPPLAYPPPGSVLFPMARARKPTSGVGLTPEGGGVTLATPNQNGINPIDFGEGIGVLCSALEGGHYLAEPPTPGAWEGLVTGWFFFFWID